MDVNRIAVFFRDRPVPSKWFQAVCIATVVFVVYFVTSSVRTDFDHFVRLADAMLDGRLYLENPPSWLELARVGEKGFVINPPPLPYCLCCRGLRSGV